MVYSEKSLGVLRAEVYFQKSRITWILVLFQLISYSIFNDSNS